MGNMFCCGFSTVKEESVGRIDNIRVRALQARCIENGPTEGYRTLSINMSDANSNGMDGHTVEGTLSLNKNPYYKGAWQGLALPPLVSQFLLMPGSMRLLFADYLAGLYSQEYFLFWESADGVVNPKERPSDPVDCLGIAETLFSVYMGPDSHYSVSLSIEIIRRAEDLLVFDPIYEVNRRGQTRAEVNSVSVVNLLRAAQKEVENVMQPYYIEFLILHKCHEEMANKQARNVPVIGGDEPTMPKVSQKSSVTKVLEARGNFMKHKRGNLNIVLNPPQNPGGDTPPYPPFDHSHSTLE